MGLPGFYLSMSGRTGAWSWLGLVILFFGIAIPYIAVQSVETASAPNRPPFMDLLVSIGAPTLFVGSLLTAIVIYSSGVYPRWTAVALVIAILLGLLARVARIPPVLSRGGLFSAYYTLIIAIHGYLVLIRAAAEAA
jgi:membrane protein YdbS with pleckstrin-like domain